MGSNSQYLSKQWADMIISQNDILLKLADMVDKQQDTVNATYSNGETLVGETATNQIEKLSGVGEQLIPSLAEVSISNIIFKTLVTGSMNLYLSFGTGHDDPILIRVKINGVIQGSDMSAAGKIKDGVTYNLMKNILVSKGDVIELYYYASTGSGYHGNVTGCYLGFDLLQYPVSTI